MTEHDLLAAIRLRLSGLGCRMFRNNVARGWVGKLAHRSAGGAITLHDARPLYAGLCVGSSDLIGWTPVRITPEMVGQTVAVFTAIEGKTGKVPTTTEQTNFLTAVQASGGIAIKTKDAELTEAEVRRQMGLDTVSSRG